MRKLGVPLIVTFHGFDATVMDEQMRQKSWGCRLYVKRRAGLRCAGVRILTASQFIKHRLVEKGFAPDRVHVHYTGIDVDRFRPSDDVRREDIVLFVGRLVEKKGLKYLIEALRIARIRHPTLKLVIIGDGPLRPQLQASAADSGSAVEFLGVQSADVVRQWMQRCAADVLSQR